MNKLHLQQSKTTRAGNSQTGFDAASVYTAPSSNVKNYSGMDRGES